jgi:hypothetical protein
VIPMMAHFFTTGLEPTDQENLKGMIILNNSISWYI